MASVWEAEDGQLDAKLAELREKYGQPPNIIHFMWDDQPFGAVGIPADQRIRGYRDAATEPHGCRGHALHPYVHGALVYADPGRRLDRPARRSDRHVRGGFPHRVRRHCGRRTSPSPKSCREAGTQPASTVRPTSATSKRPIPTIRATTNRSSPSITRSSVSSTWRAKPPTRLSASRKSSLPEGPYRLDKNFVQDGYVFYHRGDQGW